jgi:hypothetical protein
MEAQRAISSSVRAQPMQRSRRASSVQIFVQGLCISSLVIPGRPAGPNREARNKHGACSGFRIGALRRPE